MSLDSKLAMGVLIFMVLISILAPLIAPYSPKETFTRWIAPSGGHLFGIDHIGRGILSCVLYGGRFSPTVGLFSTLTALFFSAITGSVVAVVRRSTSKIIV